jgi:hypothetical protein
MSMKANDRILPAKWPERFGLYPEFGKTAKGKRPTMVEMNEPSAVIRRVAKRLAAPVR